MKKRALIHLITIFCLIVFAVTALAAESNRAVVPGGKWVADDLATAFSDFRGSPSEPIRSYMWVYNHISDLKSRGLQKIAGRIARNVSFYQAVRWPSEQPAVHRRKTERPQRSHSGVAPASAQRCGSRHTIAGRVGSIAPTKILVETGVLRTVSENLEAYRGSGEVLR